MKQAGVWADMTSTVCIHFMHVIQKALKTYQGEGEKKQE
jgi:hypothetical protein